MTKNGKLARWLVTALMFALSFAVFYALAQRPSSDISIHAAWASEGIFSDPRSFVHHVAHPLWHVMVAAVLRTGLPLAASAALVTALWKAAEVWLLIALSARLLGKNGWLPALCGLTLSLVSAVLVPAINPRVYLGAGSPNTWHSPTQIVALTMMLLCLPMVADAVDDFHRRLPAEGEKTTISVRHALLLSALLVISLLAKPTFMQAFLPAACLYFLVMWIRRPKNGAFFWRMVAVAVPSVVLMVLQSLYYFWFYSTAQGGSAILLVTWQKAGGVAVQVLLTRAFPLFVLLTCAKRDIWSKPIYQLGLLMDAISILEMLLLSETGRRAADGNFSWAMMGSSLMLWTLTLPLFIREAQSWFHSRAVSADGRVRLEGRTVTGTLRLVTGSALLLWHLASGIYYIVYLMTTTRSL